MKLLLTSSGLENKSIINALANLLQKPFSESKIAFIPTAANLEDGDKWWLIDDLKSLQELKFRSLDIVDISALPEKIWKERLNDVDVIFISGGNTYHLMYWFNKSGFSKFLPELLKTKIYVGVSAGTVVATPNIINAESEKQIVVDNYKNVNDKGLFLVDFMIEPHINSQYFPEFTFDFVKKESQKFSFPIYAIDDNTAIKIDGEKLEVISEGVWKKFEK